MSYHDLGHKTSGWEKEIFLVNRKGLASKESENPKVLVSVSRHAQQKFLQKTKEKNKSWKFLNAKTNNKMFLNYRAAWIYYNLGK